MGMAKAFNKRSSYSALWTYVFKACKACSQFWLVSLWPLQIIEKRVPPHKKNIWSFHSLQKNTWWGGVRVQNQNGGPSRNIQNQPTLATQLGSSDVALSATYFVRMSRKGEVSVPGNSSSCRVFLAAKLDEGGSWWRQGWRSLHDLDDKW